MINIRRGGTYQAPKSLKFTVFVFNSYILSKRKYIQFHNLVAVQTTAQEIYLELKILHENSTSSRYNLYACNA